MAPPTRDIEAAGAVVLRRVKPRKGHHGTHHGAHGAGHGAAHGAHHGGDRLADRWEVLLVHRPKYDDWSFPKGKLERREHPAVAAVREVEEETGLRIRLGRPLRSQRYRVGRGWKRVHYWVARVRAGESDDVTGYERPGEIDRVAWVPIAEAGRALTYPHDRATLREAIVARKATYPLIVLRHGEARARDTWRGPDPERPLLATGKRQAERIAGILAAYGVTRVVSSTSTRCTQTVAPYAEAHGVRLETTTLLSEEGAGNDITTALVVGLARDVADGVPLVVCSHRPVLPTIFAALGIRKLALEKGELAVAHLRKGKVVAIERHLPV